jgi:hypothetical protein
MKNFRVATDHYPSPYKVNIIDLWSADINKIYTDWIYLYTDHIFFSNVAKGIKSSNTLKKNKPYDFFYMAYKYYINSLCLAIRSAVDPDPQSVSLLIVLSSMYIHNEFLTLEHGKKIVPEGFEDNYEMVWNKFTEEGNRQFISKKILFNKIEKLIKVTNPVKKYANKNLAHRNREGTKKQSTKYSDIWNSANFIISLLADIDLLLTFSSQSLYALKSNRYSHLYGAWFNEDFRPEEPEVEKFEHIVLELEST